MQCKQCGKPIGKRNKTPYCKKCSGRRVIKILHKRAMGRKRPKEVCEKIRKAKLAGKNPMWRGNNVGYYALHNWVRRNLPKPKLCECCKKVPPYDLANKGIYDRNLKNWEWICRRCHMVKDGRIDKIKTIGADNLRKINPGRKINDGLTRSQRHRLKKKRLK